MHSDLMNIADKKVAPALEKFNNALAYFAAQAILIYQRKDTKSLII